MNDRATHQRNNRKALGQEISGDMFKYIRKYCGYTAREFARFSSEHGGAFRTERSVYGIESNAIPVKSRYVDYLRELVGAQNFALALEKCREMIAGRNQRNEESRQRYQEAQERSMQEKDRVCQFITLHLREGCSAEDCLRQFPEIGWCRIKRILSQLRDEGKVVGQLYRVSRWYAAGQR